MCGKFCKARVTRSVQLGRKAKLAAMVRAVKLAHRVRKACRAKLQRNPDRKALKATKGQAASPVQPVVMEKTARILLYPDRKACVVKRDRKVNVAQKVNAAT